MLIIYPFFSFSFLILPISDSLSQVIMLSKRCLRKTQFTLLRRMQRLARPNESHPINRNCCNRLTIWSIFFITLLKVQSLCTYELNASIVRGGTQRSISLWRESYNYFYIYRFSSGFSYWQYTIIFIVYRLRASAMPCHIFSQELKSIQNAYSVELKCTEYYLVCAVVVVVVCLWLLFRLTIAISSLRYFKYFTAVISS